MRGSILLVCVMTAAVLGCKHTPVKEQTSGQLLQRMDAETSLAPRRTTLRFVVSVPSEPAQTRETSLYTDALAVDGYIECVPLNGKKRKTHYQVLDPTNGQITGGEKTVEWPSECQEAKVVDVHLDVVVNFIRCSSLKVPFDAEGVLPNLTLTVPLPCERESPGLTSSAP